MILGVLFLPTVKIGKLKLDTYWIVALLGAAVLLVSGQADVAKVGAALVSDILERQAKLKLRCLCMSR